MEIAIKHVLAFNSKWMRELARKTVYEVFTPNRKFFKDKKNIMLIAFNKKDIAGYLWAFVLTHPNKLKPAVFLHSIDVFEGYRRKGAATKLIHELKRLAKKLKCYEIFVLTEASNTAAMKLYEKTSGVMFVYMETAFLNRIALARKHIREGQGVRFEDLEETVDKK